MYSVDTIEKLKESLREKESQPVKKQQLSKLEAVKMLAGEIKELQKRGYTLEQVCEFLREGGIDISTPTLRNYLQRAKEKKRAASGETTRKRNKEQASDLRQKSLIEDIDKQNKKPQSAKLETMKQAQSKATFVPTEDSDDL